MVLDELHDHGAKQLVTGQKTVPTFILASVLFTLLPKLFNFDITVFEPMFTIRKYNDE